MTRTITELGPREAAFLATLAGAAKDVFTLADAEGFWGQGQTTLNVLSRLESKGWLERLERGKYMLVPLEAGVDREWSEDPLAVGTFIVPTGAAAYWTAARHWGWTTQLPRTQFFIAAKRRSQSSKTILGVPYRFVTLRQDKIFGITQEWVGSLPVRVTNRERTVLDILDRPDLAGGIAEVSEMLPRAWSEIDPALLTEYVERFGSGTVPKRLGYLAEQLALTGAGDWIDRWQSLMGEGFTRLERGGAETGRFVRRWRLRINTGGDQVAP
ncbi:MAG: type IV toxin-antitoxin system AbiEi family antitoxin domain-containing protein [Coriobacteriia bacterium]|nr:type IV toxin-antitoxin system AbiEi family antitoxin domain-containing protein [Coriobacteriia bacterium]